MPDPAPNPEIPEEDNSPDLDVTQAAGSEPAGFKPIVWDEWDAAAEGAPEVKPSGPPSKLAQPIGDAIPNNGMFAQGLMEGKGELNPVGDVVAGVYSGVRDAFREVEGSSADLTGAALSVGGVDPDDYTSMDLIGTILPDAGPQKTTAGRITKSITQFAVGMVGAGKLLKSLGWAAKAGPKALQYGRTMVQGATADAVFFDPMEERLSNLLEEHTSLGNPVSEYLAAAPDDSRAEGRFKNALEGMVLGPVADLTLLGLKQLKRLRGLKAEGAEESKLVGEAIKAAEELEAASKAAGEAQAASKAAGDAAGTPAGATPGKAPDVEPPAPKPGPDETQVAPAVRGEPDTPTIVTQAPDDVGIKPIAPKPGEQRITGDPTPRGPTELMSQELRDAILARNRDGYGLDHVGDGVDFNISKYDGEEGAKRLLDDVSNGLRPEIEKKKGGIQPLKLVEEMADAMGEKVTHLYHALAKDAKDASSLAARLVAGKELMWSLANKISREAQKVDSGLATPDELNRMIETLGHLQMNLKAVQTGAARATGAGRIRIGDKYSNQQIKMLIAAGGNAKAVIGINNTPMWRRAFNAHTEYWINMLLSGPKTHLVNLTSNLMHTLVKPVERITGSVLSGDMKGAKEGASMMVGLVKGAADSFKLAYKAFKLEEAILDPKLSTVEMGPSISAQAFNLKEGAWLGSVTDFVGKTVRMPTRFLTAEDEFFKQINYRAAVYASAVRDGAGLGLTGDKLAKHIEARVQQSVDAKGAADPASRELEWAREATFTNDLGKWGKAVQNLTQQCPPAKLILPFVRTPTNIFKQFAKRGPLALASGSFYSDVAAGGARRADALGKLATGGAAYTVAISMAMNGQLTGKGPSDGAKRAQMMATGWRPYSIKTGDKYVSYARLDPWGMFLGITADFAEAAGQMKESDLLSMSGDMMLAVANNLTSKSYLRGLTEVLEVLQDDDPGVAERWIQSRTASYLPHMRQFTGAVGADDPNMREVRGVLDALMNKIPGLSDNLPPKLDFFGAPITYPMGYGPDSVSPIGISTAVNDKVKDELARFPQSFQMPADSVNQGRIDLRAYKDNSGKDAYQRLLELRGTVRVGRYTLAERLEILMDSKAYQDAPEGTVRYASRKLDMIEKVLGQYHDATMKELRQEFKDTLDADIRTDERNKRTVRVKGADGLQGLLNLTNN